MCLTSYSQDTCQGSSLAQLHLYLHSNFAAAGPPPQLGSPSQPIAPPSPAPPLCPLTRSCAYVRLGSGWPPPKSGRGTALTMDSGLAPSSSTKMALAYGPGGEQHMVAADGSRRRQQQVQKQQLQVERCKNPRLNAHACLLPETGSARCLCSNACVIRRLDTGQQDRQAGADKQASILPAVGLARPSQRQET